MHLRLKEAESLSKGLSSEVTKGLENALLALHHLPPPISIKQIYHSTRDLVLMKSRLPCLQPRAKLTKEEFKNMWEQAQPEAKDVVAFMWAIGEFDVPIGVIEIVTSNPSFYISRYCIRAVAQIAKHHQKFYANPTHKSELPLLPPYGEREVAIIHGLIAKSGAEHEDTLEDYAKEELIFFQEVGRCQQWLKKYHSYSFPPEFFDINLQSFATRAIKDFEHTVS